MSCWISRRLEVNTMVVAQITGNKFSAETAYDDLYGVNEHYLHYELGIHEDKNLCDRYLSLRNRVVTEAKKVLQEEEGLIIDENTFDLPNPDTTQPQEIQILQKLLNSPKFLRTLRKADELKAGLDSTDSHSTQTDIIYAQTIIQLDGDVIHRYHELLFQLEESQKRMIMDIHQQSVMSGEAQWRGLLGFMVSLVRSFISASSNPIQFRVFTTPYSTQCTGMINFEIKVPITSMQLHINNTPMTDFPQVDKGEYRFSLLPGNHTFELFVDSQGMPYGGRVERECVQSANAPRIDLDQDSVTGLEGDTIELAFRVEDGNGNANEPILAGPPGTIVPTAAAVTPGCSPPPSRMRCWMHHLLSSQSA
ncbi:hypothetical protein HC928_25185 [bacterium]|nr:hypothetical protein [bacterium]